MRKGQYSWLAGSTVFLLILNLVIVSAPGLVQEYTGVNTSQLQNSTDISADVQANQTDENNVVDQAGALVSVYTNFNSQNLVLSAIGTVFLILLIATLIDLIWIG